MSLTVVLNGHARVFASLTSSSTLDLLVRELGLQGDRVAIEHNGEIVSRAKWSATALSEQDKLEVVHFVGGGSATGQSASLAICD